MNQFGFTHDFSALIKKHDLYKQWDLILENHGNVSGAKTVKEKGAELMPVINLRTNNYFLPKRKKSESRGIFLLFALLFLSF
jgi:hypothetical protein